MKELNRMWMVAAAPLVLLAMISCVISMTRSRDIYSYICLAILAGALLTGLYVLITVFAGWWRGAYQLKRGDMIAAIGFASIDVLIPTTLAVLVWSLSRIVKKSGKSLLK